MEDVDALPGSLREEWNEGTYILRGLSEGPPGELTTAGEAVSFLNLLIKNCWREAAAEFFFWCLFLLMVVCPFMAEVGDCAEGEEGVAGISVELIRTRRVRGDSDIGSGSMWLYGSKW